MEWFHVFAHGDPAEEATLIAIYVLLPIAINFAVIRSFQYFWRAPRENSLSTAASVLISVLICVPEWIAITTWRLWAAGLVKAPVLLASLVLMSTAPLLIILGPICASYLIDDREPRFSDRTIYGFCALSLVLTYLWVTYLNISH